MSSNPPLKLGVASRPQHFNLSWNKLESVPDQICNMTWLKRLTLDNNHLKKLPENIGKMQGLDVLWIGMNEIEE